MIQQAKLNAMVCGIQTGPESQHGMIVVGVGGAQFDPGQTRPGLRRRGGCLDSS